MGAILSMFGDGLNQEDEQCKNSDKDKKARHDELIKEIKDLERCAYCYLSGITHESMDQ